MIPSVRCKGGDPAAGSPTATLLRLLPPRATRFQMNPKDPFSTI